MTDAKNNFKTTALPPSPPPNIRSSVQAIFLETEN